MLQDGFVVAKRLPGGCPVTSQNRLGNQLIDSIEHFVRTPARVYLLAHDGYGKALCSPRLQITMTQAPQSPQNTRHPSLIVPICFGTEGIFFVLSNLRRKFMD
jgi:hypothetical protein